MNPKLIGIATTTLIAVAGGGRLIYDEVRLASTVSISKAQALYRQDDATRASRLTLELAEAEASIGALGSAVALASTEARNAEGRVQTLEDELRAVREDFSTTAAKRTEKIDGLSAALTEAQEQHTQATALLLEREADLRTAQTSLATLETERNRLQQRATDLDRQAKFLAQELSQREAALAETGAAHDQAKEHLARTREHLDATQTELASALKAAGDKEAVLKALRDAGVDIARLSGADPMPMVRGFVVRVDTASVPPVVLVHVGARSGLRAGDRLFAVRKGRRIATLEVDGVQEDICTTRIVIGQRGLQLAPRDEVFSWEPER